MTKRLLAAEARPIQISRLTLDAKNTRSHGDRSIDAIAESLRAHGQRKPVVCQQRGMELVVRAGNGTVQAAQRLGWKRLAVVIVEEDDDAARSYAIRDNRTAELSGWDVDALHETLEDLDAWDNEGALDSLGFADGEFQAILDAAHAETHVEPGEGDSGAESGQDGGSGGSSTSTPRVPKPFTGMGKGSGTFDVFHGDCLDMLRGLEANSVDAIVTDPPYGYAFMNRDWDKALPPPEIWAECLRVAKPGSHIVAFGATRMYHRLACAIEDAGWEIRDCLSWMFGSGFPKSLDVSKAIDMAAGATREVVGTKLGQPGYSMATDQGRGTYGQLTNPAAECAVTAPATDDARTWDGWGTALKPGYEPIILARKPLDGTVADCVLKYGTGALFIDGCRIGADAMKRTKSTGVVKSENMAMSAPNYERADAGTAIGRWPANVVMDEAAGAMLDEQAVERGGGFGTSGGDGESGASWGIPGTGATVGYGDAGGPSRFFYCPKASVSEREAGLDGFPLGMVNDTMPMDAPGRNSPRAGAGAKGGRRNVHPTVKPVALMQWLVRLITPPGGLVVDPFTGSGSTGCAAVLEDMRFQGAEMDDTFIEIARARIAHFTDAGVAE